jgi:hypothetical protein
MEIKDGRNLEKHVKAQIEACAGSWPQHPTKSLDGSGRHMTELGSYV